MLSALFKPDWLLTACQAALPISAPARTLGCNTHGCRSQFLFVWIGRQRRATEAKLEVAKEVSHENGRLQEKLHSYRKEVRQLESSRHARSQEAQVLQAQLRYRRCIYSYSY